ncbi:DNA topoisomerase 3 [Niallia circulans]|uniref:type IA DNA topoisomerase n=1 Tax=Bacillaceae TaxID=186817 RepID=UPI00397D6C82
MDKKIVILAEKPSQAKAYAEAFNVEKREKTHITLKPCNTFLNGAVITWGIGHLVSLKLPQEYKEEWGKWSLSHLPIIPESFEFKVSKDKQVQFNAVKKLFKNADVLINACDVDREGSNIFYSILNMTGVQNKIIKRLWINSLEVDEVRKGFNNLQDNSKDLLMYTEAKTRQISDWLVGINASQLYTLLLKQKGLNTTLSVGRVQSPTVYMIYQRQKEIENFISKPFYELFGEFKAKNGFYKGKAKLKEENKQSIVELLEKNNLAEMIFENGVIKNVTKELKKTKSPRLHSLSTLQTIANKRWKYSPAKVLETMQALYEKKIVTYPRTDTNYITENEFQYLSNNVEKYQNLLKVSFKPNKTANKRYVDGSKVAEHYAIIPTKTIPSENTLNTLTNEEKNIYHEILKTTLAMFHSDYVYEETNIMTDVNSIEFYTKGKIEVSKGWKELFKSDDNKENENESDSLPSVQEGETTSGSMDIKEGFTSPPKPYTEGGLINMMKTAGKLVEDESDSEILKEIEGIGTEATRSGIIETIKKNGYIEVKKNIVSVTEKGKILCKAIEGNLLSSPSMTAKWENYLKKIGEGKGTQEHFFYSIKKFLNATINEAPNKVDTDSVNVAVEEQNKEKEIALCPLCKGSIEDKGKFYGCSGYKNGCKVTFPKTLAKKAITKTIIKTLCDKGKTNKLKGFKNKEGKAFEAKLKLNDKHEIKFEFN